MKSSLLLTTNSRLAEDYLLSRRKDADTLVSEGICNQPYAKVSRAANGGILVNEVWCASALCAAAYILARWW